MRLREDRLTDAKGALGQHVGDLLSVRRHLWVANRFEFEELFVANLTEFHQSC